MSGYHSRGGAYDLAWLEGGSASHDRLEPHQERLQIITGYHCYDAAQRLCSVHSMVQLEGRAHGDGDRAWLTAIYNGRRYRITVEPEQSQTMEGDA